MFEQFEIPAQSLPWIHLLWTVPAVILLCGWGISRRRRTLAIFGYDAERSSTWVNTLQRRRWSRALLLAASLLFLTAAAIQPRCNPERTTYKTSARDIAIILDVSRSMLADDLQPSRLERAKLELARLLDSLEGDRVGLITFAGDAVVKCPLTANYSYFKRILRTVTTHSVPQGGTKIGDAIRKALRDLLGVDEGGEIEEEGVQAGETVMEEELRGRPETFADILIITDGEDHESYPEYAARQAARLGVGIYAVGLGSEKGTPIPTGENATGENAKDKFIRSRDGEVVLSRLDSKTLQTMVNEAPRGQYLPVGTYNFDLVSFFDETLAKEGGRDVFEKQVFWTEIYQPFLFAGLLLYLLYLLVPERPRIGQLAMEKATEETA
jgi:Ca-activated chloride channel family protein